MIDQTKAAEDQEGLRRKQTSIRRYHLLPSVTSFFCVLIPNTVISQFLSGMKGLSQTKYTFFSLLRTSLYLTVVIALIELVSVCEHPELLSKRSLYIQLKVSRGGFPISTNQSIIPSTFLLSFKSYK